MSEFHFDSELAKKYGVYEAVILYNFIFWIKHNKANNKHFYNGTYWTYNTVKAFSELFNFMTKDQIRRALERLEAKGAIITGNYNNIAYDRTTWYAVNEDIYSKYIDNSHLAKMPNGVGENAKCELAKMPNGIGENAKPIPDINTDIKPDRKHTHTTKELCVEIHKILGEEIPEPSINELIRKNGIATVKHYMNNWDKYRHYTNTTQASHFICAVKNKLPEPKAYTHTTQTSNKRKASHENFDQRTYDEEELEKYYANFSHIFQKAHL